MPTLTVCSCALAIVLPAPPKAASKIQGNTLIIIPPTRFIAVRPIGLT
jgi:hypothetical protein